MAKYNHKSILPKPFREQLHTQLTWHAISASYYAHIDRADLASAQWCTIAKLCKVNGGVHRGAAS
jgi:hypothetical protein